MDRNMKNIQIYIWRDLSMKIGIFTQYYLNYNYGGNLQAYALCKVLNELGHEAVQISYGTL